MVALVLTQVLGPSFEIHLSVIILVPGAEIWLFPLQKVQHPVGECVCVVHLWYQQGNLVCLFSAIYGSACIHLCLPKSACIRKKNKAIIYFFL